MRRKIALDAASLKTREKILAWMIYKTCQELFLVSSITVHAIVDNIFKSGYRDHSRIFRLGFFDQETEGTLNITSFHGANSMLDISEEYSRMHPHIQRLKTERIPLVRLDDFVAQHNIKHIGLVKIDVEGVEKQILLGGQQTFANKVDTVVMEMSFVRNPRGSGEFIELFQLMHDYGFAPAEIYDVVHAKDNDGWKLLQLDCVFRKY